MVLRIPFIVRCLSSHSVASLQTPSLSCKNTFTFEEIFTASISSTKRAIAVSFSQSSTIRSRAEFNLSVLAGMEEFLPDLKPAVRGSHKNIFNELFEDMSSHSNTRNGAKKHFLNIPLLSLLMYFSSQEERNHILRLFINFLLKKDGSVNEGNDETSNHDSVSISLLIKNQLLAEFGAAYDPIGNSDDAFRFLLAYLYNSLKYFDIDPCQSDINACSRFYYELEMFCSGKEYQVKNTDPRLFLQRENVNYSPLLRSSINLSLKFFRIISGTLAVSSPLSTPIGLKCWQVIIQFLVKLDPLNSFVLSSAQSFHSYVHPISFSQFCRLPFEAKISVIDLIIFLNSDAFKDEFFENVLLFYFTNFSPDSTTWIKDVDFCFLSISKIFKLVPIKSLKRFLELFVHSLSNQNQCCIFSILALDQKIRLEQCLFTNAKRYLHRTPDALAQFLNMYASIRKVSNRNFDTLNRSISNNGCQSAVELISPIYKWNLHSLLPLYGLFGCNSLTTLLKSIHPRMVLRDPRILLQGMSIAFSFPPQRIAEIIALLFGKLVAASKTDDSLASGKHFKDLDSQSLISSLLDIHRLTCTENYSKNIQFINLFPDILFKENLNLSSIVSALTDHPPFIFLVNFVQKHPSKSSAQLGAFYRSLMVYFYKNKFFYSYSALLKRLLESEPIDVFIASHESTSCSVLKAFFQNVIVLISMNDSILLLAYFQRISACVILSQRLTSHINDFINHSITSLKKSYSEEHQNIPYYLSLKFCLSSVFSQKLGTERFEQFFSTLKDIETFGDLHLLLNEINANTFLNEHERHSLLSSLEKKQALVQILENLKLLKENEL